MTQERLASGRVQHDVLPCRTHGSPMFHLTATSIVALCGRCVSKVLGRLAYQLPGFDPYLCDECHAYERSGSGARTIEQAERLLPPNRR